MSNIAGQKSSLSIVTNLTVVALVVLWLVPTVGLLVSSFRDRDQISETGWWRAMFPVSQAFRLSPDPEGATLEEGLHVLRGDAFGGGSGTVSGFGITSRDPGAGTPGQFYGRLKLDVTEPDGSADTENYETSWPVDGAPTPPEQDDEGRPVTGYSIDRALSVTEEGAFTWLSAKEISRAPTVYIVAEQPPDFGLMNYELILTSNNMDRAFINTLTVTIPATIIPILIAAFAAYALAGWTLPGAGC